jgi:acyl-CoA synthetase (AMP-forming)/AMP-acid ligase II
VKAVVVLKDGFSSVTGDEILSWSKTQMATYKAPRLIEFTDALPRTADGAVDREAVKARWGERA